MKVDKFLGLREVRWVEILEGHDFEVAIVPAAADSAFGSLRQDVDPIIKANRVCSRAFVNFRNAELNGKTLENTIENRLMLYSQLSIQRAIDALLFAENAKVLEGEESGGSD